MAEEQEEEDENKRIRPRERALGQKIVDTGFMKIFGEHVNDANKHFISNVFSIIKS